MTRSFGIVDHKMAEADFFLEQMSSISISFNGRTSRGGF